MNRKRSRSRVSRLFPAMLTCAIAAPCAASDASDAMRDRLQACDACHAKAVASPEEEIYYPPINGKPVEYLYQQLLNFKEGRRVNLVMSRMLAYLSSDYLHEIADWYSRQPPAHTAPATDEPVVTDPERAARARVLVQTGEGSLAACTACHGGDLKGDGVAIPGLRGLSAHYLSAQLGAWKAGTRQAREPDCMAEVARALSGADVDIVAQWIASARDEDLTASKVDTTNLPHECGAVQ